MKQVSILGVQIDNLDEAIIEEKLELMLSGNTFSQIATVNPEFILEAQRNQIFGKILSDCALNIADGFGISLALLRQGRKIKTRLAGADLMHKILALAEKKGVAIFLVARRDGLSSWRETRKAILKQYPNLLIKGANINRKDKNYYISSDKKTVLLCNFGAPHQEIFIHSQKDGIIGLGMGVGGSFDYLTGKVRRAPTYFRYAGLEWVWRAVQPQPWKFKKARLKRIWKSVIVFPIKIILK